VYSTRNTRAFDEDDDEDAEKKYGTCFRGAKQDMASSFEKKSHLTNNYPTRVIGTVILCLAVISYPMAASGATPAAPRPAPQQGIFADHPPTSTTTITTLSQSSVFANLPRERPLTRAIRELNDLKDLQDYRLDVCAERGVFWEQCFMFGEGTSSTPGQQASKKTMKQTMINNGLDYQLISPLGALDPGSNSNKKNTPPTWW
jgi:hypothetical protein